MDNLRALTLYYWVIYRIPGGRLFRWSERTGRKLQWSRSAYYRNVACLLHHGLIQRDRWGKWALKRTTQTIKDANQKYVQHSCTLKLKLNASEKHIEDMLRMKILEMKVRQIDFHAKKEAKIFKARPANTYEQQAMSLLRNCLRALNKPSAGSQRKEVTMRTDQLANNLGLSLSGSQLYRRRNPKALRVKHQKEVIGYSLCGDVGEGTYIDSRGYIWRVLPSRVSPCTTYPTAPARALKT